MNSRKSGEFHPAFLGFYGFVFAVPVINNLALKGEVCRF
jgi:hypothetical protein